MNNDNMTDYVFETAKLFIPENEMPDSESQIEVYSPKLGDREEFKPSDYPRRLRLPLKSFELDLTYKSFPILELGRKYYKNGQTLLFNDSARKTSSSEILYCAIMFSQTSGREYSMQVRLCKENSEISDYQCSCLESQKNRFFLCYHLVAGFFSLRNMIKENHVFSLKDEDYNSDSGDSEERPIGENQTNEHGSFSFEPYPSDYLKSIRQKFLSYSPETPILRELICQICLEILIKPIQMPCKSHSICEACVRKYLLTNNAYDLRKGRYKIHCPTCGENSGSLRILREEEDLVVNKELERIRDAHLKDLDELEKREKERREVSGRKRKREWRKGARVNSEEKLRKKVHSMRLRSYDKIEVESERAPNQQS